MFKAPQVSWHIEWLKAIAFVISHLFCSRVAVLECRNDGTLHFQTDHIKIGNPNLSLGRALYGPLHLTNDNSLPMHRFFLVLVPFVFYNNHMKSIITDLISQDGKTGFLPNLASKQMAFHAALQERRLYQKAWRPVFIPHSDNGTIPFENSWGKSILIKEARC